MFVITYQWTILSSIRVWWLIIISFGFKDLIYWYFFAITINYDSSQSMTLYDSHHSLLDHERLLFHCDEWRTTNHCSHIEFSYESRLSDESLLRINYDSFITSRRPDEKTLLRRFGCYCVCCHRNLFSNLLPSNDLFVAICCSGTCFPSRCSAMNIRSGH
jgi:hypothetical protein